MSLPVQVLLLLGAVSPALLTAVKAPKSQPKFIPSKICYDGLGCFSTGGNFYDITKRPIQLVPQSPERIGVTYALYTRKNLSKAQYIKYNDAASVAGSNFRSTKATKVIMHGFLEDARTTWMHDMMKALLLHGDYNVILLDWSRGNQLPYTQATANTRVVGAVLAQLVKWLESEFKVRRSRVHLIGHSLGAHICGYAGERLRGLGRITGLDPAGPYFENTHPEVRLDPTDAEFVDAIHTDGDSILNSIKLEGGLGMMQSVGHVDFYPNGGKVQPRCDTNPIVQIIIDGIIEGTKWIVACHHLRVMPLMTNTILNGPGDYKAVPCDSYENFKAGRCTSCGSAGCAQMGMGADKWNRRGKKNIKMFLDTTGRAPFELHHYIVKVTLSIVSDAKRQYGNLNLVLRGANGKKADLEIVKKDYMEVGAVIAMTATSSVLATNIARLDIQWQHKWLLGVGTQYLVVNRVEVFEPFTEKSSLFCADDARIKSGKALLLAPVSSCF